MSNNVFDKTDVTLLGAGCASLSLASRASELEDYDFTVIDPETYLAQDHIWGFWQMPWLSAAVLISRKKWPPTVLIPFATSRATSSNACPRTPVCGLVTLTRNRRTLTLSGTCLMMA